MKRVLYTLDDLYSKARDGIVFGFLGGTLVAKLVVLWESETYEDSGFTGMFQWRGVDGPPHDLKGVFHGFGTYEVQLLKLEGQWISPHHEYDGILIS